MAIANWKNQTIWTGDNLDIMRGMNSESVDLIYLDPPFNSNRTYSAPIGSEAAGAAFKDSWTLDDVDIAWIGLIAEKEPCLPHVIDAAGIAHGKGMKAYLVMMAVRLLEMKRLLKPTGSIYLHCDPTASHYLKLVMDCVFGAGNFRSEIIWRRVNPTGRGKKRLANDADYLIYFVKGDKFRWNPPYKPHSQSYVQKFYRHMDANGRRYTLGDLKGDGQRTGSSGNPWRGIDPTDTASHWAVPNRTLPDDLKSKTSQEKLEYLDSIGRIYWPPKGGMPRYKRYLDEMSGTAIDTIWDDIQNIQAHNSERLGYPTQKPLALLDRIIKASSNEGDVVLDPFCGCATTCVSAHALGRLWTGIDISSKAAELIVQRLQQDRKGQQGSWMTQAEKVIHRTDIPRRTDVGELPPYKTHRHTLYGQQEGRCGGCRHHFPFQNFTVDHIVPRAKGGTDHLDNLQLLCNHCNSVKGTMDQAAFAAVLKERGIGTV